MRGHGRLGRLIFCTGLQALAQASRSQLRCDPARPLQLAADAAMFAWQALLPLPAAAKAAKRITWMKSPLQLSSQPAGPQPAGSSDVEPAALVRRTRPARWQELAACRSSQSERHMEAAAAAMVEGRTAP